MIMTVKNYYKEFIPPLICSVYTCTYETDRKKEHDFV